MTLLRFEQGAIRRPAGAGAAPWAAQAGGTAPPPSWWPRFDALHRRTVGALLLGLLAWGAMLPAGLAGLAGAGVLLVGGALIGIPHGSSDFVVAHRLMRPRFGPWWLPAFLAAYLAAVALMLVGWRFLPGITFLAFLGVSAFHFGSSDEVAGRAGLDAGLHDLARAATPVVPIFLVHSTAVAGIIGLMSGQPAARVAAMLDDLRPAGLALYAALLGWVVFKSVIALGRGAKASQASAEGAELALLAVAACLLPPLLVFAVYFCLLHAVRHMAQLGRESHPRDGHAALRLASAIVIPSALASCLALALTWDAIAGALSTTYLLAAALQVTAALTVPHVVLEALWRRKCGTAAARPSSPAWSDLSACREAR